MRPLQLNVPSDNSATARGVSAYRFRAPTAADHAELVALFNRSFAPNGVRSNEEIWRWQYGENGANETCVLAEHVDSGCISGYMGNVPLRTWHAGRNRRSSLSLHHMVAPERRRGLQKSGLLAGMVRHWIDRFCQADRDFVGWGFPNTSNYRVGHRFNDYTVVRNINALVATDLQRIRHPHSGIRTRVVHAIPADLDGLWEDLRGEVHMGVARDHAYLTWRYDRNPAHGYQVVEARDAESGRLRGLGIVRMGADQADVLMTLEWLVPIDDQDAGAALLTAFAQLAQEHRAGALSAWFPEPQPWFERFQELGFRVRFTPTIWVARSGDPAVTVADIRQHFYATYGDVDYF